MNTYKSSDLTNHNRAEVFEEAINNGAIIEIRNTNGKVRQELILHTVEHYNKLQETISKYIQLTKK